MLVKNKILTISSDPGLADLLKQDLGDGEYEIVSTRHTGIHLKDILDTEDPDFIILDIMMPNLDGIEICLRLRQWTQLPIMMLSTWDTGDRTVRGLNLGSDGYLTEPFGMKELKQRIDLTLKREAARAESLYNTGIDAS